jgi:hypothetical protein
MMHALLRRSQFGQPRHLVASFRAPGRARLATAIWLVLSVSPAAWTQYPFAPQPAAPTGPTLGSELRNAAAATQSQADIVRRAANEWGHRASSESYRAEFFQQDFANLQAQFQTLRDRFNILGSLAVHLGHPPANNAAAELDAGLNIIAELFAFLGRRSSAGTLDRPTIVRTCRAFEDALWEWERELRKGSARLELVW